MWILLSCLSVFLIIGKVQSDKLYTSFQYIEINDETISLYDTKYNPFNSKNITLSLSLCYGDLSACNMNPLNTPTLWIVLNYDDLTSTIQLANNIGISVLVFVADNSIPYYYLEDSIDTLIFTMPSSSIDQITKYPQNTMVKIGRAHV